MLGQGGFQPWNYSKMRRSIWTIEEAIDEFGRMSKPLVKKYRRELKNLLVNLQAYLDALNEGATPVQIQRGFLHPEPHGILAIDQRGEGQGLKEFRLYIYPDTDRQKLYLLALGDKNTQKSDIASCIQWVHGFREHTRHQTATMGNDGNSEEGRDARHEQGKENGV